MPSLYSQITCNDLEIDACVAVEYEDSWWLGLVKDIYDEMEQATVKFYHPLGPEGSSTGFKFPTELDELTVHVDCIISVIAPGRSKFYDLLASKSEEVDGIYIDFKHFWLANQLLPSDSESE